MECSQLESYLDRLMDGTLTGEELGALESHAAGCKACSEALKATRQLKAMLDETAPEIDVPLEAQAMWRSAVKAEAAGTRRRRRIRFAGGIAAALVVLLGVGLLLRPAVKPSAKPSAALMMTEESAAMEAEEDMADLAMIEADGAAMEAKGADAPAEAYAFEEAEASEIALGDQDDDVAIADAAPMQEVLLLVDDLDEASAYICDLIKEYEGKLDEQRYENNGVLCANLFVDMPTAANAAEFLRAAAHYDRSGAVMPDEDDFSDSANGDVSLLLVLKSAQ